MEIIKGLFSLADVNIQLQTLPITQVEENIHLPIKIEGKGKRCKVCYSKKGPACSISKIKCGRCSELYDKDIALCLECFGEFHSNPETFLDGFKKQEENKENL